MAPGRRDHPDRPPAELANIPTVCGSLREALDSLDKDHDMFPMLTETLGVSMRVEIERMFESVVFEKQGDFRQLFTTRDTYVNGDLAPIYGLEGIEGPDCI